MTPDQLKKTLRLHTLYLQGDSAGVKADLTSANLRGADLTSADLTSATLPRFQIPQEGSLIVYKRLNAADGATRVIAKLMVPSAAKRTATPIGRKCRAKYAKVLGMVVRGTNTKVDVAYSTHQRTFEYRVGQVVRPDKYDDDIRVECTSGVHFFLTKEEAEEY